MKINPICVSNFSKPSENAKVNCCYTVKSFLGVSTVDKISFGNVKEKNLKKLTDAGYNMIGELEILDVNNKPYMAKLFKKALEECHKTSEPYDIKFVLTDDSFNEIGKVGGSTYYYDPKGLICCIDNYSNIRSLSRLHEPLTPACPKKFKNVGRNLYKYLSDYLKKNEIGFEYLIINAISSDSWAFHKKIGFFCPYGAEDYDCYERFNELRLDLKSLS